MTIPKRSLLTLLALGLTVLLAACQPDAPTLTLTAHNESGPAEPATCDQLRGRLTLPDIELEVLAGPEGSDSHATDLPFVEPGMEGTVEAWCTQDDTIGYARVDGTVREILPILVVNVSPPATESAGSCDTPTESTEPVPCIIATALFAD